jgi:ABC-type polysaccharide/polyol phosphate export permease/tetratricopeptide (TPR) repeat protein
LSTRQQEHAQLEVDAYNFLAALQGGALDACLRHVERASATGQADPLLTCKLAEALLHQGRRDDALACARSGFPACGDNPALLRICAWVFSNCDCHGEAAAAYRRLIERCPDWSDGHRHLSAALAEAGRADEAIAAAMTAVALQPDNPEFALHMAGLLADRHRAEEAADWATRAVTAAQEQNPDTVIDAAEVLMRCGQAEQAATVLRRASAEAGTPRLWRVLSGAEMLCGRLDGALEAAERARGAEPDNAEFALHYGNLLWQRGDMSEAALAFAGAARLDPGGRDIRRTQLSFYLAAGLTTEATAAGGDLLHRFPDDRNSVEAVLHLLNYRLDTIDGQYIVLGERAVRAPRPPRPPRPPPGLLQLLHSQRRVVRALIVRETRTRFADTRLGYGWALIEPILHIALLSATFAVLMHGRPPIGSDFFVFYYTGLIPYHVFVHSSTGMSHALINNAPLLQLPPVSSFDVIAARGLLEVMTDVVVAVVLLTGFLAIGLRAVPDDLWEPSLAVLTIAAFGCGVGFANAVVTVFWRSWEKTYAQLTRLLYFVSGIFYVPGMMPDRVRDILVWNPLLHAIDWFRSGFFDVYRPHWLDRSYVAVVAIVSLLVGLALHRLLRRRLSAAL